MALGALGPRRSSDARLRGHPLPRGTGRAAAGRQRAAGRFRTGQLPDGMPLLPAPIDAPREKVATKKKRKGTPRKKGRAVKCKLVCVKPGKPRRRLCWDKNGTLVRNEPAGKKRAKRGTKGKRKRK